MIPVPNVILPGGKSCVAALMFMLKGMPLILLPSCALPEQAQWLESTGKLLAHSCSSEREAATLKVKKAEDSCSESCVINQLDNGTG